MRSASPATTRWLINSSVAFLPENNSGNVIDWTLKNGTFSGWNNVGNSSGFTVLKT